MLRITKDTKFPDIQDAIDIIDGIVKPSKTAVDNSWSLMLDQVPNEICQNFIDTALSICIPWETPYKTLYSDDEVLVKKVERRSDIGEDLTAVYITRALDDHRYFVIEIICAGGNDVIPGYPRYLHLCAHVVDYFGWRSRFCQLGNSYTMYNSDLKILFDYIYSHHTNKELALDNNTYDIIINKLEDHATNY